MLHEFDCAVDLGHQVFPLEPVGRVVRVGVSVMTAS